MVSGPATHHHVGACQKCRFSISSQPKKSKYQGVGPLVSDTCSTERTTNLWGIAITGTTMKVPGTVLLLLKFDIPIWLLLLINSVEVRAQCFHLYFLYFFPQTTV